MVGDGTAEEDRLITLSASGKGNDTTFAITFRNTSDRRPWIVPISTGSMLNLESEVSGNWESVPRRPPSPEAVRSALELVEDYWLTMDDDKVKRYFKKLEPGEAFTLFLKPFKNQVELHGPRFHITYWKGSHYC